MPTPTGPYTIDVPGWSDVIKIPALESKELKRARIERLRTHRSAVPGNLQWIPHVITKIDDFQDGLIVSLYALKFLLKRLPLAILPGLGWILLANDIMNLATLVLQLPISGRPPKVNFLRNSLKLFAGRAARVRAARRFLNRKTPWLPFVLQGGQVLESFTGYGLQLGSVFGAISDTFWSGLRTFQGQPSVWRGPRLTDPIARASDTLANGSLLGILGDALFPEDRTMALVALAAATELAATDPGANLSTDRQDLLFSQSLVSFTPWEPSSRAALLEAGFDPDAPTRPPLPPRETPYTYGDMMQMSLAENPDLDSTIARALPADGQSQIVGLMCSETAHRLWALYTGDETGVLPYHTPYERLLATALEQNIIAPSGVPDPNTPWPQDATSALDPRAPRWYGCKASSADPWVSNFLLPAAYPPGTADALRATAHWLKLALCYYCQVEFDRTITKKVQGCQHETVFYRQPIRDFSLQSALLSAAIDTWGNAWRKPIFSGEGSIPPDVRGRVHCVLGADGLPTLSGREEEFPFVDPNFARRIGAA